MPSNYLPTNYHNHDLATADLFESKSLDALIFLIDHGRELEFTYCNQDYFISCDSSKQYVSLWYNKTEQSFSNLDELIHNAILQNVPFLTAWEKIELQYLF